MKKVAVFVCFCILYLGFCPICSQAQQPSSQNFIVFEEFVSPADIPAYMKVQTQAKELWDKYELKIPIYAYRNDDNAFYWIVPMENFASLDTLFDEVTELYEKMKTEDDFDGEQAFRDLYHSRQTVIHWSENLSYHPSGNFGQSLEEPYVEWAFCYLKSGHEKEAGAAVKKWIEFYNSIEETYEWDVYVAMLGHDLPMWILMTRAKSKLALITKEKELLEKYGKEFGEMWAEFSKHLRRMENKTGWFMPKFSNLPEE